MLVCNHPTAVILKLIGLAASMAVITRARCLLFGANYCHKDCFIWAINIIQGRDMDQSCIDIQALFLTANTMGEIK